MDSPNMLSIPTTPSSLLTPPPHQQQQHSLQSPLDHQKITPKQAMKNQPISPAEPSLRYKTKRREVPILKPPRRTNRLVWCAAILCLLLCLSIIFLGITTLIVFLCVKPKIPAFDIPGATLNLIYANSLQFFNGDLKFLANFSNPNKKLDIKFEHSEIGLYYSDSLIATQALQPFVQRRGGSRLVSVHMISSLVYLPPNAALQLQRQLQRNRVVVYNVRGNFRVRINLGILHFSYWLHGRCQLDLTSPPNGVLIGHSCKTKR